MGDGSAVDGTRLLTTDDAPILFFPGQKLVLEPLDGPETRFSVCQVFTPVTKSVVVLAEADNNNALERVVIKIYDPRYLDERINPPAGLPSCPWTLAVEQAAAMARPSNSKLSSEELASIVYSIPLDSLSQLSPEEQSTYHVFLEEAYYRSMMFSYHAELGAYKLLKDLQGSVIPHLLMAGQIKLPDERAIQPHAVILEHVPSVHHDQLPGGVITPAMFAPLIEAVDRFAARGVVHADINLRNILFTPPERPRKAILIDFGCAEVRDEDQDEDAWQQVVVFTASDGHRIRQIVENCTVRL